MQLGNHWIQVECPNCRIENEVRLIDVLVESTIICRGCYQSLHLIQQDQSATQSFQRVKSLEGESRRFQRNS